MLHHQKQMKEDGKQIQMLLFLSENMKDRLDSTWLAPWVPGDHVQFIFLSLYLCPLHIKHDNYQDVVKFMYYFLLH